MNPPFILKKENNICLRRKIIHILGGIIGLFLLIYNLISPITIFIILCAGIIISLISIRIKIPIISFFLDNVEESSNKLPGRGAIFAVAGSLLALQLFDKHIALASIAILTFADPISHLVGRFFGKTKNFLNNKKNIEGHIAGALASSVIAVFFVPIHLALSASLMAMLFESLVIEIQKIELDDNLIIPLVAGTTMFLIQRFLI